jgi:hypothetical protein
MNPALAENAAWWVKEQACCVAEVCAKRQKVETTDVALTRGNRGSRHCCGGSILISLHIRGLVAVGRSRSIVGWRRSKLMKDSAVVEGDEEGLRRVLWWRWRGNVLRRCRGGTSSQSNGAGEAGGKGDACVWWMSWKSLAIGGHWWEAKEPRGGVVIVIDEVGRHRHSEILVSGKEKSRVRGSLWWRLVPGGGVVIVIGEVDRHSEILVIGKEKSRVRR